MLLVQVTKAMASNNITGNIESFKSNSSATQVEMFLLILHIQLVLQKVPSFERSEKTDRVLERLDESINIIFSIVKVKASTCA